MTEVLFYHLENQPVERVLPPLLEKSLERGWRVVVQAASEEYFGKPAAEIDLAQAALLAGLIQRPSATDPYDAPDAALVARKNRYVSWPSQPCPTEDSLTPTSGITRRISGTRRSRFMRRFGN